MMNTETDTLSGWFVLNSGFKVYGRCPGCHSPNISYHKVRATGLKGISQNSKGLIPVCLDCGKSLPTKGSKEHRPHSKKWKMNTSRF
jgi:hypothetical protein